MTMTAEDYLREENEILRGQLETAKAGLDAAISKSRWQAVTNAELSAAQRELAAYKRATNALVAKWKRQTDWDFGDRANAMFRCADELEDAILAANARNQRPA